jgi:hypothetical protein
MREWGDAHDRQEHAIFDVSEAGPRGGRVNERSVWPGSRDL